MRHFLSFLVSFFYVLNVVAAPAWFPEGIQTKGSSTIGEKSTANSSAVLDVRSTTKGMLPPRMTTAQRTAIASPATGLLVYDTDTLTVWQYNGTGWVEVGSGGAGGAQYNVIENYDFEATTYSDGWTASGGTLAAAAGSNILFGAQSATWDASASTQTLSYTSQAIGEGYKSNNCEGAIFIKTPSGTATHTVQVWDGTNVLASVTVYSTTTAKEFSTGAFPCPSSGNWQLRIVANADEPLIAVDNAYLGLARNVAQCGVDTPWVSFTPMVAGLGSAGSASNYPKGLWRRFGDSAHVRIQWLSNSSAGSGTAAVTFSIPSGMTIDTAKLATVASSDGYMGTGWVYNVNTASQTDGVWAVRPETTTTVSLSRPANATTNLRGDAIAARPVAVNIDFILPIVGWTASQCVTPEQQGWFAAGYISGGSVSLGTTAVTSYQEATNSSLTLTPDTGSAPIGITCSSTNASATPSTGATTCSAGNESLGIAVNIPRSGRYEICGQFGHNVASSVGDAGINVAFEWVNTATNSQTIIARMGPRTTSGHYNNPASGQSKFGNVMACGQATLSAGLQAFRLFYEQSIPSSNGPSTNVINIDADPNIGDRAMRVTMRPITTENQAILANSVSTSNTNGDRILRGHFNCDGSSAVLAGNENGTSSIGNISSGACVVTFSAFSSAPQCVASIQTCAAPSGAGCFESISSVTTATTSTVRCKSDSGADCTSSDFYLICTGPR